MLIKICNYIDALIFFFLIKYYLLIQILLDLHYEQNHQFPEYLFLLHLIRTKEFIQFNYIFILLVKYQFYLN